MIICLVGQQDDYYGFFLKYKFTYFNWRLITLQHCIGFAIHQHESATGIHMLNSYSLNSVEEFSLFYN